MKAESTIRTAFYWLKPSSAHPIQEEGPRPPALWKVMSEHCSVGSGNSRHRKRMDHLTEVLSAYDTPKTILNSLRGLNQSPPYPRHGSTLVFQLRKPEQSQRGGCTRAEVEPRKPDSNVQALTTMLTASHQQGSVWLGPGVPWQHKVKADTRESLGFIPRAVGSQGRVLSRQNNRTSSSGSENNPAGDGRRLDWRR